MKTSTTIAAALFSIISLAHLLRLFFGWQVSVGGATIPVWVSAPAFLLIGWLGIALWKDAARSN